MDMTSEFEPYMKALKFVETVSTTLEAEQIRDVQDVPSRKRVQVSTRVCNTSISRNFCLSAQYSIFRQRAIHSHNYTDFLTHHLYLLVLSFYIYLLEFALTVQTRT